MQEKKNYPFIQDLYNATNRNYDWEQFKYAVPKQYHQHPPTHQPPDTSSLLKLNYIDDVLKIKKFIPGPSAYEPKQQQRPLSGKLDRRPRTTVTEAAMNKAKKYQQPGPGAYFTRPQTADNKFNPKSPQYRQHYLHEVEYLSSECPGVGQYNVQDKTAHVSAPKYFKPHSPSKESVKRLKTQKGNKQNSQKTIVSGTFDWIGIQKKPCHKNGFGVSKRFAGPSKFQKKPGPNSYKLNTNWKDSNNMLKTSSSFTTFKSVYYH